MHTYGMFREFWMQADQVHAYNDCLTRVCESVLRNLKQDQPESLFGHANQRCVVYSYSDSDTSYRRTALASWRCRLKSGKDGGNEEFWNSRRLGILPFPQLIAGKVTICKWARSLEKRVETSIDRPPWQHLGSFATVLWILGLQVGGDILGVW